MRVRFNPKAINGSGLFDFAHCRIFVEVISLNLIERNARIRTEMDDHLWGQRVGRACCQRIVALLPKAESIIVPALPRCCACKWLSIRQVWKR